MFPILLGIALGVVVGICKYYFLWHFEKEMDESSLSKIQTIFTRQCLLSNAINVLTLLIPFLIIQRIDLPGQMGNYILIAIALSLVFTNQVLPICYTLRKDHKKIKNK